MANKKIGILFGMENTFPPALVDKINAAKIAGRHGGVCDDWRHPDG
jgi:hypothetical protein